jgi:Kelch motif
MLRNLGVALGVCLAVGACNDSPTTDPTAPASDPLESPALASLESNTWATLTKTLAPRAQVAGAAIGNVIYLVGGWRFTLFNENRGSWATNTLQTYDVETDRWSARTLLPAARREVNGASLIGGRLGALPAPRRSGPLGGDAASVWGADRRRAAPARAREPDAGAQEVRPLHPERGRP